MTIEPAISKALIEKAKALGGHSTEVAAMNAALEQYVRHLQQVEILELFGTVEFDPGYDYKASRRLDSHP